MMDKLDEIMDRIIGGGMYLFIWGAFLLLGLIVFGFSTVIGILLIRGVVGGIIVGLAVTFGLGYVLYKAGNRFWG
jgi:hypothetical protein